MTIEKLPNSITRQPHTRYDASALGLDRREFERVAQPTAFRGVHHLGGVDPSHPRTRIAAAAKLLPDGAAIGGWAAAHLLGATDLDGITTSGDRLIPIPICIQPEMQLRDRPGIVIWRSRFEQCEVIRHHEVPILGPVRSCFDLARRAPDLTEAVVGIDAMLRANLVELDDVGTYAGAHPRRRGGTRLRRALGLADPGTRSCGESRFRVLWMVDAGMPRPMVNAPVYAQSGRLLGLPDLFDLEAGLAGEYDGADHRRIDRHTADNSREELFEAHGITVVRVTGLDLTRHRLRTVERLRIAYARGLARDRSRDGWMPSISRDAA